MEYICIAFLKFKCWDTGIYLIEQNSRKITNKHQFVILIVF